MPQISIIMPVYNTDKYLRRTLDALLNQTFGDIEIIAIDDGSTDDSLKILNEYAERDSRVVVITQKNSGPATARNKGLDAATGKYLMFCDSDDWYEPNMCQVMFDTIEKQKTDLVTCHLFSETDDSLTKTEHKIRKKFLRYLNPNKSGKYELTDKLIIPMNVMLWNKIWRMDIIRKYDIRFPDGHEHDDDAFVYMYSFVAKDIFFTKKRLYHYLWRADSIMSSQYNKKPKNKYDNIVIANYVLDFMIKHRILPKHAFAMCNIFLLGMQNMQHLQSFTPQELISYCADFNVKIANILRQNAQIAICNQRASVLVTKKSYLRLLAEWVMYVPMRHIIALFVKHGRLIFFLNKRYMTNIMEWRYRQYTSGTDNQTVFYEQYN